MFGIFCIALHYKSIFYPTYLTLLCILPSSDRARSNLFFQTADKLFTRYNLIHNS